MQHGNFPVTLSNLASLDVTGADATTFLHGQFCADLLSMPAGPGCLTAWCTARGRVITTLFAWRHADGWTLILPANLAERVTQRLRMFILRADIKLQPSAPGTVLLGLDTDAATAVDPADRQRLLRRPGESGQGERFFLPGVVAPPSPPSSAREWTRHEFESGMPWVDAGTSEKFLPQELNLERWQGLSYTKGCYPGQEIVARLRYRGTVKRGLFRLRAARSVQTALVSGSRLLNSTGEPVATVLYAADNGSEEVLALAVVEFSAGTVPVLYCETGGAEITMMGPVES